MHETDDGLLYGYFPKLPRDPSMSEAEYAECSRHIFLQSSLDVDHLMRLRLDPAPTLEEDD